ncbi:MAG: NADH-quinone oxidoreductase subunit NuoG [Rhizomicrobium sp.]
MTRTLIIDGKTIEADDGITLLSACEQAGAEIPRFCYHERLSVAGNCRMCLVEWVGAPKLVASCSLQVKDIFPNRDGTPAKIETVSPKVREARAGVMELLLINHPLDCPICDQGGECDLQDQAFHYGGSDFDRFHEDKRAVKPKNMGPLIGTAMTRCIQCTRCVRFATEVAGVPELGATGRGTNMEITTYLDKAFSSELSGNIIDLCPVGALTSRPYAFRARPWELSHTESIDVMDAQGAAISIDTRGDQVLRILPRVNEAVNEQWIGDKTRFIADGLMSRRIDKPYIREDGKLKPVSWGQAIAAVAARMGATAPERMAAIVGDLAGAEEIKALKDLMDSLGVPNIDCRQDGVKLAGARPSYLFNTTIAAVEQADALVLIGSDPRVEAPVLNARLRKAWLYGNLKVARLGAPVAATYPVEELGDSVEILAQLASGEHPFTEVLRAAQKPMLILGAGALARHDGDVILRLAAKLAMTTGMIGVDWNGFNVLHTAASRVAGLDLGFVPGEGGRDVAGIVDGAQTGAIDVIFSLGADEYPVDRLGRAFVIYLGSHGDAGARFADVVLPGAAYSEKDGLYANFEGRVQETHRATFPPGEAREDWLIIRELAAALGRPLPYTDKAGLRAAIAAVAPQFAAIGSLPELPHADPVLWENIGAEGLLDPLEPVGTTIRDYYLTNPIARASKTMAECSKQFVTGAAQSGNTEEAGA